MKIHVCKIPILTFVYLHMLIIPTLFIYATLLKQHIYKNLYAYTVYVFAIFKGVIGCPFSTS